MEIAATPPATPAAPASPPLAAEDGEISSDFETFLRMLTVQMENQDPLNPVNSEDFAVQLATFSAVEQQVRTNDLLVALSGQLGGAALSDLAGWVGMEIRAPVPAQFDGAPVDLSLAPSPNATAHVLSVRDATGAVVQRLAVAPGETELQWTGVADDGTPLAQGPYSFELEAYDGEALISTAPVAVYAGVTEARVEPTGTVLVTDSGATVSADQVTALRAPQ